MIETDRVADLMGERIADIVGLEIAVEADLPALERVEANERLADGVDASSGAVRTTHPAGDRRRKPGGHSRLCWRDIGEGEARTDLGADDDIGSIEIAGLAKTQFRNFLPVPKGFQRLGLEGVERQLRGRRKIAKGRHMLAVASLVVDDVE